MHVCGKPRSGGVRVVTHSTVVTHRKSYYYTHVLEGTHVHCMIDIPIAGRRPRIEHDHVVKVGMFHLLGMRVCVGNQEVVVCSDTESQLRIN